MSRAGGPISDVSNPGLLRVPPLSVPLRQRIVEKLVKEGDGESKRVSQLQGEMFAMSAKVSNEAIEMVCFDVLTVSESASSGMCGFLQAYCCRSMIYSHSHSNQPGL